MRVVFSHDFAASLHQSRKSRLGLTRVCTLMRKVSLLILGALSGFCAGAVALETHLFGNRSAEAATNGDRPRLLVRFGEIFERVRTSYVDKPDDRKLIEGASNGMLASLDPHSNVMDAKSLREMET